MSTEREKFEAWAEPTTALGKDAKGQYVEVMTSLAFEAWEARAALGEQSTPAPQVDMRPYETWIAIREGHLNAAAEEYFSARPQLDSAANRRIFYAGHCKGYEVAAPQQSAPEPQGVPVQEITKERCLRMYELEEAGGYVEAGCNAAHPQPPAEPQQVRQIPVGKKYVPGVSQEVHDRFNAVLLGESPLSKVDPVQAAADEFNNTFHKCRAEVSSDWWQRIWQKALAWKADHPQQERKPLGELDIEAAAKVLADAMDYPWTFMPHQGRENMKETARSICNAAHPQQSAPAAPVALPWATTAEDAASELAKWLNERPNRPICLEHVAVVVHSVQSAAAPVAPEPDEDEAAAWMYPCDVEKFKRGEHVGEAFSIKVGSPTHGVSVPLFTKDQLIAYAAACVAAARAPTQERKPLSDEQAERMAREWAKEEATDYEDLIRRVEAAHGITSAPTQEPT